MSSEKKEGNIVIYLLYVVFLNCPTPTISVIIENVFAFLIIFISVNSDTMVRGFLMLNTNGGDVLFFKPV